MFPPLSDLPIFLLQMYGPLVGHPNLFLDFLLDGCSGQAELLQTLLFNFLERLPEDAK